MSVWVRKLLEKNYTWPACITFSRGKKSDW